MSFIKKNNKTDWINRRSAILHSVSRWVLGIVFIYASYDKILNPAQFAEAIFNYQILPDHLINICALVLPWLELILGICLILGILMPGAVLLVNLLLIVFVGALLFNLYRGLDISCGCFSTNPGESVVNLWTVARDASFMLFSFHLFICVFVKKENANAHKKTK